MHGLNSKYIYSDRFSFCVGVKCEVLHRGQNMEKSPRTYTKGRESVHSFKACQNETRSSECKSEGHKPGAILCPQYVNDNSADVKAFDGDKCSFDFFPCELKVFGGDFNSTEQTLHLTTAMH